jgi:hypothetical protein
MTIQEDVHKATRQDQINITTYGNPVVDLIADVGIHVCNLPNRKALEKVATVHPDGTIEFRPDTYVICYLQGETCVFGPFAPAGQNGAYAPGGKYRVAMAMGDKAKEIVRKTSPDLVTELVAPEIRLGGGGANVLAGFFDVFGQLKVQFIATVENSSPSHLNPLVLPLANEVGVYEPLRLYTHPGISLCLEDLGLVNERTIFTSELCEARELADSELPRPRGKSIMVDTVYSQIVALDALANTLYPGTFAVLALTKSLCSKVPIPISVFQAIRKRHPNIFRDVPKVESIHDFLCRVVLPRGNCVCVMNDEELGNFTELNLFTNGGGIKTASLAGIVEGLKLFREFQKDLRHRVYVTAGRWGSFVLDEKNHLIYCGVYVDNGRSPKGKTAIGDTYATFVLSIETIGNYIRPYVIPAEDVIRAAAAGSDACIYYGFGEYTLAEVNLYVAQPNRIVVDLGPLEKFPTHDWAMGLDRVLEREYLRIGQPYSRVPQTLAEVIGKAFLANAQRAA